MKRNHSIIKKYPFSFSKLMLVLFVAALMLSVAGMGLTVWRFLNFWREGADSVYGWLQYIILALFSILLCVLIIAMLVRSQYIVTEKQVILQFGLIKTKYDVKTIYSLHLFKDTNKLTVYFDDYHTKYTVIVVKEKWYLDFIQTLCELRPSIEFTFSSADGEENKKEK